MMRSVSRFFALVLVTLVASVGTAFGQSHPVEGVYAVTATGNEIGTVTFTLTLKRAGTTWSGEVTDSALPFTVKSVTVSESNNIKIMAAAGDTEVTIEGAFDGMKIAGNWSAGEAKGAWSGARKDAAMAAKPAASAGTSGSGATAALEGTYDAEVVADGQGALPFTLIVKKSGDKLATEVQNAGDLNIVGIEVNGEAVTLKATFQGNPFDLPGKIAGSEMNGKWEAGGFTGSWKAKKKN